MSQPGPAADFHPPSEHEATGTGRDAPGRSLAPPLDPAAFDLDPDVLWVQHCAEGPVPRSAAEAVTAMLGKELRPWIVSWEGDFVGLPAAARREAAHLLGARTEDVTLTATTTTGLATVAQGLDWRPGDEVVVPLGEFPSNYWPWRSLAGRGVELREVPLWSGHEAGARAWESAPPSVRPGSGDDPEARLLAALGERTRVLAVSWVRFQDGLRLDLGRLAAGCRESGVELVVDGIQGAGTLAADLEGLAAFAAGGHKGLLAPQGLGFLWTAPELRRRLMPPGGWLSVAEATNFARPSTDFERPWAEDGTRLETGVPNLLGAAALAASLELIGHAGAAAVEAHVQRLQGALLAALAGLPAWRPEAERLGALWEQGRLGAILSLHHGGRGPDRLGAILAAGMERGIYASVREGYLRVALHGWHRDADLERLLAWLEAEGGR